MLEMIRKDLIGLSVDQVYAYFAKQVTSLDERFCTCIWNDKQLECHKKYRNKVTRREFRKTADIKSRYRKSVNVGHLFRKDFTILVANGKSYIVEVFFKLVEKHDEQYTFNALHTTHKDKYCLSLVNEDDLFGLVVSDVEFQLQDVEYCRDDIIYAYEHDKLDFTTDVPYVEALAYQEKSRREIDAMNAIIERWGGSDKFTFGT